MEWIPSHTGIPGNEKADNLAKRAGTLTSVTSIKLPKALIYRRAEKFYREEWQQEWNKLGPGLIKFKPRIGPTAYMELDRCIQVPLTRLRLGTTMLTHGLYFPKMPRFPRNCQECDEEINIEHLLVTCPRLEQLREPMKINLQARGLYLNSENILNPDTPGQLVYDFLSSAGYLSRI